MNVIDLVAIVPFYISIILFGKEMLLSLHCFSLDYNLHFDHPLWYKDAS